LVKRSLKFMEDLVNSFGPSGFEEEPARIVRDYVSRFSDRVYSDKLGSVMFETKGTSEEPKVLLAGHMDEVGFIVSSINEQGFLTFNPLGWWFHQVLLGQRVVIRTDKGMIGGVIAAKPPHLLPPEERSKLVHMKQMFVDIGASNADEAKAMGVRVGNPMVPDSRFSTMKKSVFKDGKRKGEDVIGIGKAFDNRIGAWVAAEVVRRLVEDDIRHPNTVIGATTTLEEEGLRGARTVAYLTKPDVCVTLDTDVAGDVPGIEESEASAKMGYGPSITTYDSSMVPNQGLMRLIMKTGDRKKIPYQLSQVVADTDAGVIHMANAGCPSVALGVPARHVHSHVGLFSMADAENCVQLVLEVVKLLNSKTVRSFTSQ
jgi:putative aminopeptidase FrvX